MVLQHSSLALIELVMKKRRQKLRYSTFVELYKFALYGMAITVTIIIPYSAKISRGLIFGDFVG